MDFSALYVTPGIDIPADTSAFDMFSGIHIPVNIPALYVASRVHVTFHISAMDTLAGIYAASDISAVDALTGIHTSVNVSAVHIGSRVHTAAYVSAVDKGPGIHLSLDILTFHADSAVYVQRFPFVLKPQLAALSGRAVTQELVALVEDHMQILPIRPGKIVTDGPRRCRSAKELVNGDLKNIRQLGQQSDVRAALI